MPYTKFLLDEVSVDGVPLQFAQASLRIERVDALVQWELEATTVTPLTPGTVQVRAVANFGRTYTGTAIIDVIHGTVVTMRGSGELGGFDPAVELP